MSRNIHWRVKFASLNGHTYSANIYEDGYSGSIVDLERAATPFETSEDDDSDAFAAVRTQTGYLRIIVEDSSVLEAIMAYKELYMTVTDENNAVCWHGYLECEAIGTMWDALPLETSIPVVSAVRKLKERKFTTVESYVSVRSLLYALFTSVDAGWGDLYFPQRSGDSDIECLVYSGLFTNETTEPWVQYPGTGYELPMPKDFFSCYQVLEELCKYFGWSLHEKGNNIELVSTNGDGEYYKIAIGFLNGATSPTTHTQATQTLPDIAGTRHSRDVYKGAGIVNITENLHIPHAPIDMSLDHCEPSSGVKTGGTDGSWVLIDDDNEIGATFVQYDSDGMPSSTFTDMLASNPNSKYGGMFCRLAKSDEWITFVDQNEPNSGYDSTYILVDGPSRKPCIFFNTNTAIQGVTYRGGLYLKANTARYTAAWGSCEDDETIAPNPYIAAQIKWGNKYLSGPLNAAWEWTNDSSALAFLKLDGGKLHGGRYYITNIGIADVWRTPEDMVYIPVDDSLTGILSITLYNLHPSPSYGYKLAIQKLEIGAFITNETIIRGDIVLGTNIFRQQQSDAQTVWERENMLCSKMNSGQQSDAIVLDSNYDPLASDEVPELDLLSRLHDWHSGKYEKLTVAVQNAMLSYLNSYSLEGTSGYWLTSIKKDWRSHEMKLAIQRKL